MPPKRKFLNVFQEAPAPASQKTKKAKTSGAPKIRAPMKKKAAAAGSKNTPTEKTPASPETTTCPSRQKEAPAPKKAKNPPKAAATKAKRAPLRKPPSTKVPATLQVPEAPPNQARQQPMQSAYGLDDISEDPSADIRLDEDVSDTQRAKEEDLKRKGEEFVNTLTVEKRSSDIPPHRADGFSHFFGQCDFSHLPLKLDHASRPMWIDPGRGIIMLEKFSPLADQATDFLITIAEPRSRPTYIHEYTLTPHSLYAAVSVGLQTKDILDTLDRFLKTELPPPIQKWIEDCAQSYGKVKLVLKRNKYVVESSDLNVLQTLLKDDEIAQARKPGLDEGSDGITVARAPVALGVAISGTADAAGLKQVEREDKTEKATDNTDKPKDPSKFLKEEDDEDNDEIVHAFEIREGFVEVVQKQCLHLGYPILEEYDFRYDDINPDLEIDLLPSAQIRPYQEKSLSKMFGNGRAKSGIIVLPCGSGKTLVGITAACTIKKGTIILCTNSVSAVQWRSEFLKWSNISPEDVCLFTAEKKSAFPGSTGVIVTTFSMITNGRERTLQSKKVMDFLMNREWGLMILDEVHVVPADIFRRVISTVKSHVKLGLTATLLREDDKISDLNFLIGPKLYEANWMELSQQGHIARVQCAEVWCPMPPDFHREYYRLKKPSLKFTLCAVNPNKFQACQYLIRYHEARGDKIIVFSDDLYTLKLFAIKMGKAYIYGGTNQEERLKVLENFRHNKNINTIFLSKIGDTSLDIPEATCLIQVSSHFGSRRQEAQRLGRILRAKRRNDEGFNAFFYSLVSKDTREMRFSAKRQAFLVDQGYSFKVITKLDGMSQMEGLGFTDPAEKKLLLQATLKDHLAEGEDAYDSSISDDSGGAKKAQTSQRRGNRGRNKRKADAISNSNAKLPQGKESNNTAPNASTNAPKKARKTRAVKPSKKESKQVQPHQKEGLETVLNTTFDNHGGRYTNNTAKVQEKSTPKGSNQGNNNAFFKKIGRQKDKAAQAAQELKEQREKEPAEGAWSGRLGKAKYANGYAEPPQSKRRKPS